MFLILTTIGQRGSGIQKNGFVHLEVAQEKTLLLMYLMDVSAGDIPTWFDHLKLIGIFVLAIESFQVT